MHKLTKPQVSAHYCAKPGENGRNANVPRRGTTFHLASRRDRATPGVLIVPLRGTIGETGIINPTFDACGAETWGFGISCVSDALLTPCRRGKRASKMHKLTKPQVSAHYCAKPGENGRNANVPRRGTTFHLASRRDRATPGVLIVPLRGTIGETGIINPTFDACGAETWGFGISCVSDALLTPCRRGKRASKTHKLTKGFGIGCVSDASPSLGWPNVPGARANQRRCRRGKRASKMHKLTKPQVSAHYCAKPRENAHPTTTAHRRNSFSKKNRLPLDAEADFSYGLLHGVTSPPWWCGWSRRCSASPRCSRPATGWRPLGRPRSRSAHRPLPCRSAAHPQR